MGCQGCQPKGYEFIILSFALTRERENSEIQFSRYLIFIHGIFNSFNNQISNKEHFIHIDRSA